MAATESFHEQLLTSTEISPSKVLWNRFRKHRLALVGLAILIFLFAFSFFGPYVSPYDPDAQFLTWPMAPLTQAHPLGSDELGRDVLTRMMWAGRISLTLSLYVTFSTTLLGIMIGSLAGYFGGFLDSLLMRLVDFMLTLPLLPLLLLLSAMSLRGGLPIPLPQFLIHFFAWIVGISADKGENVVLLATIMIVFGWMGTARLVRGQAMSVRNMEYMDAARALGASPWRMIFRQMMPNIMAPIIVAATFGFGQVIILEAALSFVGFGIQPPSSSWGSMLNNVRDFMLMQPWRAFVPGFAIFLASISYNFMGDALRDALDPHLKR
jgi:peptide/nickel transport system permease protein